MKNTILFLATCFLIVSCKHELERPNWDVELLIPLVKSELSIENMMTDSNITIEENNEGFVSLIFQENFLDMDFDTLIKIDDIADEQNNTLDSVTFKDVVITDTSTIESIIHDISNQLGIPIPNGTSLPFLPAYPAAISEDTIMINTTEYFKTMDLYKGKLIMEIINNYPVDLSNINLTLINNINQNTVGTFYFSNIASGTSASDTVDIGGQTLDEDILGILHNIDIDASSGPVLINYEDALINKITVSDIGVTEATAIFPEQELTEKLTEHSFDMGSAQIKEIGIKEGTVSINVLSTLPNGKMIYNIPSLKKDGMSFKSGDMIIPEATSTEFTVIEFDFKDYVLDLTGQDGRIGGDTVNTIYTESYTYIDSTGELITINHTDSFYSFVEFNIIPKYAIGYLGQDTIEFGPDQKKTKIFNKVLSGSLSLEKANLSLSINNSIGADAKIVFKELSTLNSKTSQTVSANTNILSNTYNIDRASLTAGGLPIKNTNMTIGLDAKEMIEILPDYINTHTYFYLNPYGQQSTPDFLYPEYPTNTSLDLNIPLSFIADKLTFIDTNEVTLNQNNTIEIEKLFVTIDNGLPLEATINILAFDEYNNLIDTLFNNVHILAAKVNSNNIVYKNTESTFSVDYNNNEKIKKIITISAFNTKPIDTYIKIYSNYKMNITMSGKLNKTIGN